MNSLEIVHFRTDDRIPDRAQPMVYALGRLMFNFGLLELLSINGIWEFENDGEKRKELCNTLWNTRTKELKRLIKNTESTALPKTKLIRVINKASKLMAFRNSVAHGSLMDINDTEFVIYDPRSNKKNPYGKKITVQEILKKIDETFDLFEEWTQLGKEKSQ